MNPMKPNGRIPATIAARPDLVTPVDHYAAGWAASFLGKANTVPADATPPNRNAWHRGFLDQIEGVCDSLNAHRAAVESLNR